MLIFSLMGAGRIARMNAANITLNSKCNLSYVYDVNKDFANGLFLIIIF